MVLKSSYWCINTIFNAGEFSSAFFSWHILSVYVIHLLGVRPCALPSTFFLWSICLHSSIWRIVLSILQGKPPRCLSLWWDFYCKIWLPEVFSFVWGTLSLFYLSSQFVSWCLLPLFPRTCNFPFLQASDSCLIWQFYSFHYFSFPLFIITMAHILYQIPFLYPAVYSYCFHQNLQFFSFFC